LITAARIVATGLFVGYVPVAPATFGSLWAIALVLIVGTSGWMYWALGVILLLLSVVSSGKVAKASGREDPKEVVIDEVVALYLAYAHFPTDWKVLLGGFLLFRAYDIVKPFPARRLESLPGGWGIVADDLVAGGYTWLTLKLLTLLL